MSGPGPAGPICDLAGPRAQRDSARISPARRPYRAHTDPAAPNLYVVTSVCHCRQKDPRPAGLGSAAGARFL
jgi:hypothetical protein